MVKGLYCVIQNFNEERQRNQPDKVKFYFTLLELIKGKPEKMR